MQVLITGKNLDIGDSLRSHIEDRLLQHVGKYFDGAVRANVTVEKARSGFETDCTLHLSTGLTLQTHGAGADAYACFDMAAEHLEKRLRRYKRRLKDHHASRQKPVNKAIAASYIIEAPADDEDSDSNALNPTIIAEASADVSELNVGEAVMQLDISNKPFVLFRNGANGELNVVYRREDGHIGWIDPGKAGS